MSLLSIIPKLWSLKLYCFVDLHYILKYFLFVSCTQTVSNYFFSELHVFIMSLICRCKMMVQLFTDMLCLILFNCIFNTQMQIIAQCQIHHHSQ
jgi:hypothetical protein